ncbi:MAG: exodeoxyribonuclease VII small subunit [Candidatus Neomarinimicrobiota bacterium]|jgi:exodeoxyribonuclease VII small subunit|nr:exodeoxyribonuclease VII small subunit [Candidatus Neomarinimicrobiota bacterium]|tara:strand:- start:18 stop:248 length:231 start_codon:yes stop_codon:yes gene_type:complete
MKNNELDSSLNRLKEISEIIDKNKLNIEESINLFEEGMLLTQKCKDILKNTEQRVLKLIKNSDHIDLEKFDIESTE